MNNKIIIQPTTIPYVVLFDGEYRMKVLDENGKIVQGNPGGNWFCCKGIIDGKTNIIFFNINCIMYLDVETEFNYIDYLFKSHINISHKCIRYDDIFYTFNINNNKFMFWD